MGCSHDLDVELDVDQCEEESLYVDVCTDRCGGRECEVVVGKFVRGQKGPFILRPAIVNQGNQLAPNPISLAEGEAVEGCRLDFRTSEYWGFEVA